MYIYFMKCQDFVKIGKSTQIKKRISHIQSCNPFPVILLGTIKVPPIPLNKKYEKWSIKRYRKKEADTLKERLESAADKIEKKLHEKFEHLKTSGEWFKFTLEIDHFMDDEPNFIHHFSDLDPDYSKIE